MTGLDPVIATHELFVLAREAGEDVVQTGGCNAFS